MIIKELELNPFAGAICRNIKYEEGLNVVLGPNEAGKSTLVNALRLVLFTKTKLTKPKFNKEIKNLMPLSGGDTIIVKLKFQADGENYSLEKAWGGSTNSQLMLPEGGLLTDDEAVENKLKELLILNEGTYNSVLITYQAGLASTIKSLTENPETSHDLISILRKAIHETDGVSVEKLERKIEERYQEYCQRWDVKKDRPDESRSIGNHFKRGVGKILKAYYEEEIIADELREAKSNEQRVEKIFGEIRKKDVTITRLKKFVDKNANIEKDARKRQQYESERKALRAEQRQIRSVSKEWPEVEKKLTRLKKSRNNIKNKEEMLQSELHAAEKYELGKEKRRIYSVTSKKFNQLKRARTSLAKLESVNDTEFEQLKELKEELNYLKTSLEAGKLSISINVKKDMILTTTKDFEESSKKRIETSKPLEIFAGGRVNIQHADWEIDVVSGEVSFDELTKEVERVSDSYTAMLDQLSVGDFIEAENRYLRLTKQKEKIESLETQFEEVLEGEDFEELKMTGKENYPEEPERTASEISRELGKIDSKKKQYKEDVEDLSEKISFWEDDFESLQNLKELESEGKEDITRIGKLLKNLDSLLEGIDDLEKFLKEYEEKDKKLGEEKDELTQLQIELAGIEGGEHKLTVEELEESFQEAEKHFEHVEKEGKTISLIRAEFKNLKDLMDQQTFDPWVGYLEKYTQSLTAENFKGTDVLEGKTAAIRADGVEVPFEILSRGTKVGMGLAVRLAMAQYFLNDLDGFLVMDDPLVDLDPDRQKAAAKVINDFSKEKQMIILTCHPRHAEFLGGNMIQI